MKMTYIAGLRFLKKVWNLKLLKPLIIKNMKRLINICLIVFTAIIFLSFEGFKNDEKAFFTMKEIGIVALIYIPIWLASVVIVGGIFGSKENDYRNSITIPVIMLFILMSMPFFKISGYALIPAFLCIINAFLLPYTVYKNYENERD